MANQNGTALKLYRQAAGLTLRDVAHRLSLHHVALLRIERGQSALTPEIYSSILTAIVELQSHRSETANAAYLCCETAAGVSA